MEAGLGRLFLISDDLPRTGRLTRSLGPTRRCTVQDLYDDSLPSVQPDLIVGDVAQTSSSAGTRSWASMFSQVLRPGWRLEELTVNYRTPAEVMEAAEPVIRAVHPDANIPVSIRRSGLPVRHGRVAELDAILAEWLAADDGIACVIGDAAVAPSDRVRVLTPQTAKGLEFDLVVLVDPAAFGSGVSGAVDRYVAMTRATRQLVVLE